MHYFDTITLTKVMSKNIIVSGKNNFPNIVSGNGAVKE